jgi:hypothetical protein
MLKYNQSNIENRIRSNTERSIDYMVSTKFCTTSLNHLALSLYECIRVLNILNLPKLVGNLEY